MNKKIYPIGFFLMVVINIALITFLVIKPRHHPQKGRLKHIVSDMLEFDEQQQEAYFELINEHHNQVAAIEKEQKNLLKQHFDLLKGNAIDSTKGNKILEKNSALTVEKINAIYAHFESIKSLCRPEQLPLYEKVLDEVFYNQLVRHSTRNRRPKPRRKPFP